MPLRSQSASSQKTLRWSECEESIPRATFETSSNHSYIVKKCQESRIQEWVRSSVGSLGRQVQPIDSLFGRWETSTSELSQRLGLGWEGGTIPRVSPESYDVIVNSSLQALQAPHLRGHEHVAASRCGYGTGQGRAILEGACHACHNVHCCITMCNTTSIYNVHNANKKLVNKLPLITNMNMLYPSDLKKNILHSEEEPQNID
jgi:hypothetical protein